MGKEVELIKPKAGDQLVLSAEAGTTFLLQFDTMDCTIDAVEQRDLYFTFDDGAKIILTGFVEAVQKPAPIILQLQDGTEVDGVDIMNIWNNANLFETGLSCDGADIAIPKDNDLGVLRMAPMQVQLNELLVEKDDAVMLCSHDDSHATEVAFAASDGGGQMVKHVTVASLASELSDDELRMLSLIHSNG